MLTLHGAGVDSEVSEGRAHASSPACSSRGQLAGQISCSFLLQSLSASINLGDQAVLEAQNLSPPFHWHWSQIQSGHWISWLDGLVIVIGTHLGWIYGNELT